MRHEKFPCKEEAVAELRIRGGIETLVCLYCEGGEPYCPPPEKNAAIEYIDQFLERHRSCRPRGGEL